MSTGLPMRFIVERQGSELEALVRRDPLTGAGNRPAAELPLIFARILSNATMDWFRRPLRGLRSRRTDYSAIPATASLRARIAAREPR